MSRDVLCSLAASMAARCESRSTQCPSDIISCVSNLMVSSNVTSRTLESNGGSDIRKYIRKTQTRVNTGQNDKGNIHMYKYIYIHAQYSLVWQLSVTM